MSTTIANHRGPSHQNILSCLLNHQNLVIPSPQCLVWAHWRTHPQPEVRPSPARTRKNDALTHRLLTIHHQPLYRSQNHWLPLHCNIIIIITFLQLLKDQIKGSLFDRARSLCQDSEIEVRKIMATEVLYKICSTISTDLLETYMLEKVHKLF
jgi:hypothetical protein